VNARDESTVMYASSDGGVKSHPFAQEHGRWDPKGSELCPDRTKPEETLVEVRRRSDVQIDGRIWV
jgi:hypothetical protein